MTPFPTFSVVRTVILPLLLLLENPCLMSFSFARDDDDDDLPIVPRLSQYSSLSRLDQEPVMIENAQYSMEVVPIIIITNNNNNDPTRTLQNYSVRFHRVMDNKS